MECAARSNGRIGLHETTNEEIMENLQEPFIIETDRVKKSLIELSRKTGMPITYKNAQRIYGPPIGFSGPSPSQGSEIFIGGIHRDCYEPELVSHFESVGKIYQIRLMLNQAGYNKGYCFVQYYSHEDAQRAIKELHNSEICAGYRIGVFPSINRTRIFLYNIPRTINEQELQREMEKLTDGIRSINLPESYIFQQRNRGIAFVEFENHGLAINFMKKFYPTKLVLFGFEIKIQWAERPTEVQGIIVTNLSFLTSQLYLEAIFNKSTDGGVLRVKMIDNYASIYFKTRHKAKLAKLLMDKKIVDGHKINVQLNSELIRNHMSQDVTKGFETEVWNGDTEISASNLDDLDRSLHNEYFQAEGQQIGTSDLNIDNMISPQTTEATLNANGYINIPQVRIQNQIFNAVYGGQFVPPTYTHQTVPYFVNNLSNGSTDFGHYLSIPAIRPTVPVGSNYNHLSPSFVRPVTFYR